MLTAQDLEEFITRRLMQSGAEISKVEAIKFMDKNRAEIIDTPYIEDYLQTQRQGETPAQLAVVTSNIEIIRNEVQGA